MAVSVRDPVTEAEGGKETVAVGVSGSETVSERLGLEVAVREGVRQLRLRVDTLTDRVTDRDNEGDLDEVSRFEHDPVRLCVWEPRERLVVRLEGVAVGGLRVPVGEWLTLSVGVTEV